MIFKLWDPVGNKSLTFTDYPQLYCFIQFVIVSVIVEIDLSIMSYLNKGEQVAYAKKCESQ